MTGSAVGPAGLQEGLPQSVGTGEDPRRVTTPIPRPPALGSPGGTGARLGG